MQRWRKSVMTTPQEPVWEDLRPYRLTGEEA